MPWLLVLDWEVISPSLYKTHALPLILRLSVAAQ